MEIALHSNDCSLRWDGQGLTIPDGAQLPDYENAIRVVVKLGKISRIALGDLLADAAKKGIDEQLTMVFEEVGISPVEVGKSLAIAAVPKSLRHDRLTEEHYFVVSKLSLTEQTKWLDEALKHNLNALEMKRSIEAGRVLKREQINELSGRNSGIVNYHGIINEWDRWRNKVGGREGILSWPTDILSRWVSEVESMGDDVAAAKQELASRK
jgi:hypothetical protein